MEKAKLLNMMRFWLFGTFVIVFVAVTVYIGLFVGWSSALSIGLPIWGIVAVLCIIWYFVYAWWLGRKK